jgi:hypothetical protein
LKDEYLRSFKYLKRGRLAIITTKFSCINCRSCNRKRNIKYNEGRWQETARRLANEINEIE